MRRLAVLLLAGAAAGNGDSCPIEVHRDLRLEDFLARVAGECGVVLLYDSAEPRIAGQTMGAGFSHQVPQDRLLDTYRAILAFYEINLHPLGMPGVYAAVRTRAHGFYKRRPPLVPWPLSDRVTVAGPAGVSTFRLPKHLAGPVRGETVFAALHRRVARWEARRTVTRLSPSG